MQLKLNGIEVDCVIGERADERTRTQRLRVDVELTIVETAAETDRLEDTVDYAALAETIRDTLTNARCQMIERAAKLVADVCCADARVSQAVVAVTKAGAIAHLESACAVYVRHGGA